MKITGLKKSLFYLMFYVPIVFSSNVTIADENQDAGFELGILKCEVVPGTRVNLLIRSTADVRCTYDNNGTIENYIGETGIALGLDISIKNDEKMAFTVIAATADTRPGSYALAGKYAGGQASAAAGGWRRG
jgi:hypothetical protein